MKKLLVLLIFSLFSFFSLSAQEETGPYKFKLTYLSDGDSGGGFIVLNDSTPPQYIKFRLFVADAPEKPNPFNGLSKQAFSLDAGRIMRDSFLNKIGVIYLFNVQSYEREVARIVINGIDLSHFAVKNGLAWRTESFLITTAEENIFKDEQRKARAQKLGLWNEHPIMSPARFREKHKQN